MSPAKKAPPKKAPVKKAPAKKAPAKKAPAKKAAAKKAPAKKAPMRSAARSPASRRVHVEMKPGPVVHEVHEAEPVPIHDDLWGDSWGDLGWDGPEVGEDDWDQDDTGSRSDGDSTSDVTDRFQAAARELIDAARTMLDVAEETVADPHAIRSAFGSLRGFADEVFRAASQANPMARRPHHDDPDDPDEFHHIPVD